MGYLSVDIGSQGTVYVSGKLGRAFEAKRSNLECSWCSRPAEVGFNYGQKMELRGWLAVQLWVLLFLGVELRHGLSKHSSVDPGNHSDPSAFAS